MNKILQLLIKTKCINFVISVVALVIFSIIFLVAGIYNKNKYMIILSIIYVFILGIIIVYNIQLYNLLSGGI